MNKLVASASVCAVLLAASVAATGVSAADNSMVKAAEQGHRLLSSGQAVASITPLTLAINSGQLSPRVLANAHLNRGLAHQHAKNHKAAVADYSKALGMKVLSKDLRAIAHYNRGLSHHRLKNLGQAIEDFTDALKFRENLAQAYYGRGNALRDAGQYLFALADYDKALKYKHPKPYLPHYGMALAFEKLEYTAHSKKALVAALDAKPDFDRARRKLARLVEQENIAAADNAGTSQTAAASVDENFSFTNYQPSGDDRIVTGSLTKTGPDLELRKKELPKAVEPGFAASTQKARPAPAAEAPKPVAVKVKTPDPQTVPPDNRVAKPLNLSQKSKNALYVEARLPDPEPAPAEETAVEDNNSDKDVSAMAGWTVQLSSQDSEQAAWDVWNGMKRKHKRLLAKKKPIVVRADLGDRGVYYRLRIHDIAKRSSARKLCSRLKRRGTGCFVQHADS